MKYYVKLIGNEISYFGIGSKVPKKCTEISESEYDELMAILAGIEDREGYYKVVHLHIDGTFEVEYIEITEEGEE